MLRFAANLTTMFTERPFLERFAAARQAGFSEVEFLFPYDWPVESVLRALRDNGLNPVLFNLPAGDWDAGERGLAALPGREQAFRDSVELAAGWARSLGCPLVHVMAGIPPQGLDPALAEATYVTNLAYAADRLAEDGLALCIEPISHFTMPGYFLRTQQQALILLQALNRPNLGLQFDCYHCAFEEPPVLETLRRCLPFIRHMQIAGVPDRHEPDSGTLDYIEVFCCLQEWNYSGAIGCEYRPAKTTEEGLDWFHTITPEKCAVKS